MRIRAWFGPMMVGMVFIGLLAASPATAGIGTISSKGSLLKIKSENQKLSEPGETVLWRRSYIYVRIADAAAVAANGYRGFGPLQPNGMGTPVDVTGMYRVIDVFGGRFNHGQGCIPGMSVNDIDQPSVAFCDFPNVEKISIKTGNGEDAVKLEHIDPPGSVPASISSTIGTGKGHDGVWGGDGPDKINTGGDNDGGTENPATLIPENVDGWGGNDSITLGTGDTFATEPNPIFGSQTALGGTGNDKISAQGMSNRLYGEEGDDVLMGGKAFDTIVGGTGADILKGGNGEDTLDATETPPQADLIIDCGKGGTFASFDIGIDPPSKNCI